MASLHDRVERLLESAAEEFEHYNYDHDSYHDSCVKEGCIRASPRESLAWRDSGGCLHWFTTYIASCETSIETILRYNCNEFPDIYSEELFR